jgi:hypothetical protein
MRALMPTGEKAQQALARQQNSPAAAKFHLSRRKPENCCRLRLFSNLYQHCEPRLGAGVIVALESQGRSTMPSTRSGGSKRGFAAMDPAKQREIASKGGKASHGGGRKSSAR